MSIPRLKSDFYLHDCHSVFKQASLKRFLIPPVPIMIFERVPTPKEQNGNKTGIITARSMRGTGTSFFEMFTWVM